MSQLVPSWRDASFHRWSVDGVMMQQGDVVYGNGDWRCKMCESTTYDVVLPSAVLQTHVFGRSCRLLRVQRVAVMHPTKMGRMVPLGGRFAAVVVQLPYCMIHVVQYSPIMAASYEALCLSV